MLTLELYPAREPGSFTLYEDDGISWAGRNGESCRTSYTISAISDSLAFTVAARRGRYQPAPRRYLLKLHRCPDPSLVAVANATRIGARRESAGRAPRAGHAVFPSQWLWDQGAIRSRRGPVLSTVAT